MKNLSTRQPYGGRTKTEYEKLLRSKLEPESIRLTLAFAGLFQMTHEMLKTAIIDKVEEFYVMGIDERGLRIDREAYRRQVLDPMKATGVKPNKFKASVQWLVRHSAITAEDAKRLDAIYDHRHQLTHELAKYLIDVEHDPEVELFREATSILTKIHRFWVQIELDSGGFFDPDTWEPLEGLDPKEVVPLSIHLLQLCIDAVTERSL